MSSTESLRSPESPTLPQRPDNAIVFVVDDDDRVRDALEFEIRTVGYNVRTYPSAQAFLDDFDINVPGCLILDVRMPGMSGLELQDVLNERGSGLPIIIISGHGDIPQAVRALKAGALDFLCKPVNGQHLIDIVNEALHSDARHRREREEIEAARTRIERLTPREKQVLTLVVDGLSSREIATQLTVSFKTVEAHRASIMKKTGAANVAQLVRMCLPLLEGD